MPTPTPQNDDVHHHANTNHHHPPPSKPNPKFLSLILKALIMSLLTSLFFLFLGLAAIFLIHLFLASRHLHRRTRHHTATNSNNKPISGLTSIDINNLPLYKHNQNSTSSDCVICLESFKKDEFFRVLPECNHVFHSKCVDSWLVRVPTCPVCRGHVVGLNCMEECNKEELWEVGV